METTAQSKRITAFTLVFSHCRDLFQTVHSDFCPLRRNGVVHPLALFSADHKTAVAEYLHMVRECWLTQVKLLKKMTGTQLTVLQNSEYLHSVFITQGFEYYRDLLV